MQDRLIDECERRKIDLSTDEEMDVLVADLFERSGHSYDLEAPLTRSAFVDLIRADVEEATACIDSVLRQARVIREEVSEVLLIGGTSKIPLVADEIRRQFGPRTVQVESADTIIAQGAALIARNEWRPYLVNPLKVRLADGSYLTVLDHGTPLTSGTAAREIRFICTDNRDGEARLVIAEQTLSSSDECETKEILRIPVSGALPHRYQHERVTVSFRVDDDVVLTVQGRGATQDESKTARTVLHNLRFWTAGCVALWTTPVI